MQPVPRPARAPAPHRRIVVATPIGPQSDDELEQVSWARTVLRLAMQPGMHPWKRGWTLTRRAPLAMFAIAVLLLLLLAASDCASAPDLSVVQRAEVQQP